MSINNLSKQIQHTKLLDSIKVTIAEIQTIDSMSLQEHNKALDNSTEFMRETLDLISYLFYGEDELDHNGVRDIFEMALSESIIKEEL